MACITPHVMQVYGFKYYLLLGGFLRLFNALFNFMIAMISTIISIWYHRAENLLFPYRIICVVGVILAIIGLVFVYQENDTKFRFDDEKEEKKSKEEIPNEVKEKNEFNKITEEIKVEKKQDKHKEDSIEEVGEKIEEDKENEKIKVENKKDKSSNDFKEKEEEKSEDKKENKEDKSQEDSKEKLEDKNKDNKENDKESINVNLNNEVNENINK